MNEIPCSLWARSCAPLNWGGPRRVTHELVEVPLIPRCRAPLLPRGEKGLSVRARVSINGDQREKIDELPGSDLRGRARCCDHHAQSTDADERAFAQSRGGA